LLFQAQVQLELRDDVLLSPAGQLAEELQGAL
jgi:hypothetical protein